MFKIFHKNKYNSGLVPPEKEAGLTLIELMVVISIFLITTGIMIFNYGKFNSSSSLQNLSDDIALTVRKAQGYAIGVRGLNEGDFNYGYGVRFAINNPVSGQEYEGSNKSFILFTDMKPDLNGYDYNLGTCGVPTTTDECMEILNIISDDRIESISENDESTSLTKPIDIVFKRPKPEPTFYIDNNIQTTISKIRIKISNVANPEIYKFITISNTGQISVSNN